MTSKLKNWSGNCRNDHFHWFLAQISTQNCHILNSYKKKEKKIDQKDKNHIDFCYVSVKLKNKSENLENNHFLPVLTQIGSKILTWNLPK